MAMAVVLIIDDDAQLRDLWAGVLAEEGFDVRVAPSGVQGVEIAASENVDVVVTDILMPDKDGIETLLEIKSACPQAKVLVVSGGGRLLTQSYTGIAKKLGADAELEKPVELGRFCDVVAELARTG